MGRLADGDPPPRLGAKYRKQLKSPDAQTTIGLAVERVVLTGWAAQAAFFSEGLEPRPDDQAWLMWLRHLIPFYNSTGDLVNRARKQEKSSLALAGTWMILLASHGGDELLAGFEEHRIIKSRFRANTWNNARALTYFLLLIGAGRALRHVLNPDADESLGGFQSQHLLEDYAEPRNKRQLVAEA
jgi:hypothetical protein